MKIKHTTLFILLTLLMACTVGPDYQKPKVIVPARFKEAPEGWKFARPQDDCDRGKWWLVFNDPLLNELEEKVNISNQNIAAIEAQYRQSLAMVAQARAAFFPTVIGSETVTRQQRSGATAPAAGVSSTSTTSSSNLKMSPVFNDFNLTLNASWEPDIWGSVRRTVEASIANAKATEALLAVTRLSAQATLAQYYFELRGLDLDQKVLNNTVENYQKLLKITKNQYKVGTAAQSAVLQVQSQLELAQVQVIDVGVNRAIYEHAIAVLMGEPPAFFTLTYLPLNAAPPIIPVQVPSQLLERRPDIAQAERLVAQANAQIGVAIAAYFPTLTLTGLGGFDSTLLKNLLTKPARFWSIAESLAETLFDGGLRNANVKIARASYDQAVANYRQTVLTAFQDVEDNLSTLRILGEEVDKQNQAVATAQHSLRLVINQYKAGTVGLSDVLNAEITVYTAEKGAADISYRRMVAAVGLIKALGGGWE